MPKQNTKERERNYLNNINLENFRGYFKETQINFGKRITLLFGKGSVGKSTIIEAISCLAESNKANGDLTGIKTKHILSKKSASKEFMLGLGASSQNTVRAIKKKFISEGSLFYPHIVELYSSVLNLLCCITHTVTMGMHKVITVTIINNKPSSE